MIEAAAPPAIGNMGQPILRLDGRAKVTGTAPYAADVPLAGVVHAYLVTSRIGRGRVVSFDLRVARALPGVFAILTHETMAGSIRPIEFVLRGGQSSDSVMPLSSAAVAYVGQPVAMVLAETFEAARDAANRVGVTYEEEEPAATLTSPGAMERALATWNRSHEDPKVGNFDTAFAAADVKVEAHYATPTQHHNPIELFATQCVWNGPRLTIYEPSQYVFALKNGVAAQLGIDPALVRVVSPFVGGAFGAKGFVTQRTALVAIAARRLGRPVKLVPTREQGFTLSTFRAETAHRLRLGASQDGQLQALSHESWELTSRNDVYAVAGTRVTSRMYACPNIWSRVSVIQADRSTPGFMRAPAETPYLFALESAMDELAVSLALDPIELRRRNDTQKEPIRGVPFTSRSLLQCFDAAGEAFGWKNRDPRPGGMRDGDWLVGWGCASSIYPASAAPTAVRVRVFADGRAQVETAGHEMGNGLYTVAAQAAAEGLGLAPERVSVALGDTDLPPAPVGGGSCSTASVCNAIAQACTTIRGRLGLTGDLAPNVVRAMAEQGRGVVEEYAEWLPTGATPNARKALYRGEVSPIGGTRLPDRMQFAFGAQLVEARVHARTREIRVSRMVGAFACGRIMNPRLARSQLMGGMVWGLSSALHEQTEIDGRTARYVNANLADYMVPVNADIGGMQVIMMPEEDPLINPLGIKGVGEIGVVGTAAAITNAVYHATGQRLRDLPLRIDNLITT